MASLRTYTFSELVSQVATAIQGSASALYDFTVGSTLRVIAEATSALCLWLQAIILQLLTVTRAATSVGSDLDTWMADYGVFREPPVASTGLVTLARFTPTMQALVPVGTTAQTADGTQAFTITLDTTNSAYSSSQNGYVIPSGTSSVSIPAQAQIAGKGGNVQAGTITVLTTPIPGVDTITNSAAYTNGIDAETDSALQARFVLYIASLSKAAKIAVKYAISSLQQGLQSTITENTDYNGTTDNGMFYVVIDDGSGFPSDELLASTYNAIDAIRALTVRFAVFAPVVITANVSMTITSAPTYVHANVVGAVGTALSLAINSLGLGIALPYTQLAAIAYSVPGVINVTAVTLNSSTGDLTATKKQVIKSGTVTVA